MRAGCGVARNIGAGGVLDVAGIGGFLGNLEEMMAASDTEGSAWSSFVRAWWNRFGTAPVSSGDLYPIAGECEPSIPIGGVTELGCASDTPCVMT